MIGGGAKFAGACLGHAAAALKSDARAWGQAPPGMSDHVPTEVLRAVNTPSADPSQRPTSKPWQRNSSQRVCDGRHRLLIENAGAMPIDVSQPARPMLVMLTITGGFNGARPSDGEPLSVTSGGRPRGRGTVLRRHSC
jgi:hypothetical protein